jgi:hypothetical protein
MTVIGPDVCAAVLLNPDISSCADMARYCIMGTIKDSQHPLSSALFSEIQNKGEAEAGRQGAER